MLLFCFWNLECSEMVKIPIFSILQANHSSKKNSIAFKAHKTLKREVSLALRSVLHCGLVLWLCITALPCIVALYCGLALNCDLALHCGLALHKLHCDLALHCGLALNCYYLLAFAYWPDMLAS